jgi:tetratricopeptide (TPR) repeat protein
MQCRFNHGVMMFKFGLVKEALEDFQKVIEDHPEKEIWAYFNRAICLIQLEEVVFTVTDYECPARHSKLLFEPSWNDPPKKQSNYLRADQDCAFVID